MSQHSHHCEPSSHLLRAFPYSNGGQYLNYSGAHFRRWGQHFIRETPLDAPWFWSLKRVAFASWLLGMAVTVMVKLLFF